MKYCTNCGAQLPDEAKFCSQCGTASPTPASASSPVMPSAAQQPSIVPSVPSTAPQQPSVDEEALKQRPTFCGDGKYRWIYELNMWTNPTILFLLLKIFFWIFVGIWVFINILMICDGGIKLEKFWGNTWPFLILMGVFSIIILIAYAIVAAFYGGKYIVLFEMDEKGINHSQMKSQVKKAQALAWLTALAGVGTGNFSMMGLGIASAIRTSMYSSFNSVRSIQPNKGRNVIKVREILSTNQVYVDDQYFDFVCDFIRSHCPKVK